MPVTIRDIGTTVTQVIAPTAPAIAAPELMQVVVGSHFQVIDKKLAGQYDEVVADIVLVDLLGTSFLTAGSVKAYVINEFGEFEVPDLGDTTDLASFDVNGSSTATSFPAYLRITRTSQAVQATGVLVVDVSTAQSANIADPGASVTVAVLNITVPTATFLTDTVLAGDILEFDDINTGTTRRFRVAVDAGAETIVAVEDLDPDGEGDVASGLHLNVVVYRPIYKLTDVSAKFEDRKTRPFDDALAAGSKSYPQPGDTLGTPSTFRGLFAFVKYTPTVGSTATWRISTWVSNTEVYLDLVANPGGGPSWVGAPLKSIAAVQYYVETEEPAVGRIPSATADVLHSYEARRTDLVSTPTKIQGAAESLVVFGPAVAANPLGLAMFNAASIGPNIQVMGVAVATEDLVGYGVALDALSTEDDPYDLVPLSTTPAIISIFHAHVTALAQPEEKRERTLTFGVTTPIRLDKIDLGDTITVTVTPGSPDKFTIAGAGFLAGGTAPGDFVELKDTGNGGVLRKFRITMVIDETNVEIESLDPDSVGAVATGAHDAVKIVSPDHTAEQQKDILVATATAYNDRRLTMVIPDQVWLDDASGEGEVLVGAEYAAVNVAALYAINDPATPLSLTAVPGISRITGTNSRFTNIQLRELTSSGILVLEQKSPLVSPVIRFEVSTDTSNKKVQQRSFTRIVDSLSKALRQTLDAILGRERITDEFLNKANVAIDSVMADFLRKRRITDYSIEDFGISETDSTALIVEIIATIPNVGNNIDITLIV